VPQQGVVGPGVDARIAQIRFHSSGKGVVFCGMAEQGIPCPGSHGCGVLLLLVE
jgi:hypothetical protein